MMYESPITLIETQMRTEIERKIEKEVFRAVKEVGVDVNKEELIKALQHDRNQYKKGYQDGAKDLANKLKEYFPSIADAIEYTAKEMIGD